jgi:glutamate racemase
MLCHNILLHEITATRLDKLKSLYGCTHFFILNVSTENCVDQEFLLDKLELQHIYFSIIAFKFQKEPTAKQKERADAAKAKKENALKGKKE